MIESQMYEAEASKQEQPTVLCVSWPSLLSLIKMEICRFIKNPNIAEGEKPVEQQEK
jgi:hypothetical protein